MMTAAKVRRIRWALDIALLLWLVAVIMFLSSCAGNPRLTDAQAKEIAQAKANLAAARAMDQFVASMGDTAKRIQEILYGAAAHRFDAGTANLTLPEPEKPAATLVTPQGPNEPLIQKEAEDAKISAGNPPPSYWGYVAGAAGGAAMLALSVLRFSPGMFGAVAQMAHTFLAPKATKEMRAAEQKATAIAQQAVAYGHTITQMAEQAGLKPQIEQVKEAFGKAQDNLGLREQIDALIAAHKAGKLPVKPVTPAAQDEHA